MAIRDKKVYLRVLLFSYYVTITEWGGPPKGLWHNGKEPSPRPQLPFAYCSGQCPTSFANFVRQY